MNSIKNDFPIFKAHPNLVYLDSSATSQKPQAVIDAVSAFYEKYYANIHRGIYDLGQTATNLFETTRQKTATFIGAKEKSEIIFTSGATESLNLVAFGWGRKFLKKGDIVILSDMEHHSNIVPWQQLKKEIGIELIFLPVNKKFRLDIKKISAFPLAKTNKIKLVSITHASNVLGTVNPINEIITYFRKINPAIKVSIDAAQSVPHIPINVCKLDCDFLAFSSHKMFGPSGVGILYAKNDLLERMDPFIFGSHMIKSVSKGKSIWALPPDKFEAGTHNLEGVVGFGASIDYLQKRGFEKIKKIEHELVEYALTRFLNQKNVTLFGPNDTENRLGIFSFSVDKVHPHDVSEILNRSGIAVRAGHHCAQPLMSCLEVPGTVRVSLSLYNTKSDIDRLFEGIEEVKRIFRI